MLKFLLLTLMMSVPSLHAITIINKPIIFEHKRIALTKAYMAKHYNIESDTITITPKIILIHHTAIDNFDDSYARFVQETLPTDRPDIASASALNVSAHFMVDRDGTIYRLMDETTMARHVIGLNYSSIGIENVGGEKGNDNLTPAQLQANIELINYLLNKYASLKYLVGHYEYRCFEGHRLWLEENDGYRTRKHDPSERFMQELRSHFPTLKAAPCP